MRDAQRDQHRRHSIGQGPARGSGGGPRIATEARVAGADRAADQRWPGYGRDYDSDR